MKKTGFIICAVLFLLLTCIVSTGCTSTQSTQIPVQTILPTVTTPSQSPNPTIPPVTTAASLVPTTITTAVITTTQTPAIGGVSVTVNSAKKKTTTAAGGSVMSGYALLELDITIQNNDKKKDFEYTDSSFLISSKLFKNSQPAKTTQYAKGLSNPFIGAPVPSGSVKDGKIIFVVPESSNSYKLSVTDLTGTVLATIDNINVP